MTKDWAVQFRRYAPTFVPAIMLTLVMAFLYGVFKKSQAVEAAFLLELMFAWTGLLVYGGIQLYSFFYAGRNVLLQLSSRSRYYTLVQLSVVFMSYLVVMYLVALPFELSRLASSQRVQLPLVVGYLLLAKVAGLAAFFALVSLLLVLTKAIRWAGVAIATAVGLYAALTFGLSALALDLMGLGQHHLIWTIGINTDAGVAVNAYVNALPILISGDGLARLDQGLFMLPLGMNLAATAICLVGGFSAARKMRVNFAPRPVSG